MTPRFIAFVLASLDKCTVCFLPGGESVFVAPHSRRKKEKRGIYHVSCFDLMNPIKRFLKRERGSLTPVDSVALSGSKRGRSSYCEELIGGPFSQSKSPFCADIDTVFKSSGRKETTEKCHYHSVFHTRLPGLKTTGKRFQDLCSLNEQESLEPFKISSRLHMSIHSVCHPEG